MTFKPNIFYPVKGIQFIYRPFLILPVLSLILCMCALWSTATTVAPQIPPAQKKKWVGTWATAPQLVDAKNMPPDLALGNNTLRQIVAVSTGGKRLRLKFSNELSKNPVTIKAVQIAVSKGGSMIDKSTIKILKFNSRSEITMEAGAAISSDPVSFNLAPRMEIAITIFLGEVSSTVTGHPGSRTTSYLLAGNQISPNADFTNAVKTDHWYVISGIDVETSESGGAVAVFGDSITDGRGSGTNKQNRWPDILTILLQKNHGTKQVSVLNLGIGGNSVIRGGLGPTGLDRFGRDVLGQSGVRWLIIFEGVNDIGGTKDSTAARLVVKNLIAAYGKMIGEAHAKGIKVYGATITPFKGASYYTDHHERARNSVNEWIRSSGHFDAVIDLDKAIRNPADISEILPEAQSDHLHPNELGYKILGEAVDLSLFK
jgi:lysophospholipase L1-like esterase